METERVELSQSLWCILHYHVDPIVDLRMPCKSRNIVHEAKTVDPALCHVRWTETPIDKSKEKEERHGQPIRLVLQWTNVKGSNIWMRWIFWFKVYWLTLILLLHIIERGTSSYFWFFYFVFVYILVIINCVWCLQSVFRSMTRLHRLKIEKPSEQPSNLIDCGCKVLFFYGLLHSFSNVNERQSVAQ